MKTMRVFVTRRIPDIGLRMISEYCEIDVWESETPPSKTQIIDRARSCEGLVTLLSDPIDREVIEQLNKLRVIAQYAVGVDNIDVEAATSRGIIVTNTPGVLTETTADLTWALIMAASRRIVEADRYVRAGNWRVAWGPESFLGIDVHGATLGIIGMGRIGTAVARRASGFGMRVIYFSRRGPTLMEDLQHLKATHVDLDTLLRESDIVTIHLPLTSQTRGMIGERELRLMKPRAVLVNTSRGAVVDENALIRVLEEGHLHAAALDVFTSEPISMDNKLLTMPNVILTPHIGSASYRTRTVMAQMCASNLIAALKGERPINIVNPTVIHTTE